MHSQSHLFSLHIVNYVIPRVAWRGITVALCIFIIVSNIHKIILNMNIIITQWDELRGFPLIVSNIHKIILNMNIIITQWDELRGFPLIVSNIHIT